MLWLRKGFGFAGPWTVSEQTASDFRRLTNSENETGSAHSAANARVCYTPGSAWCLQSGTDSTSADWSKALEYQAHDLSLAVRSCLIKDMLEMALHRTERNPEVL